MCDRRRGTVQAQGKHRNLPNRDLVGLRRDRAFLSSTHTCWLGSARQYCVGEIDVCVQAYEQVIAEGLRIIGNISALMVKSMAI
jgi:hypothetical protein